jgi:hypothetical protein
MLLVAQGDEEISCLHRIFEPYLEGNPFRVKLVSVICGIIVQPAIPSERCVLVLGCGPKELNLDLKDVPQFADDAQVFANCKPSKVELGHQVMQISFAAGC